MNCNCKGCNYNNQVMGSTIGKCGFFCKVGRGVKKVANFVNDLGLLPPGINVLVNAGAHALGADEPDAPTAPTQAPDNSARQLNQRGLNSRMGNIKYRKMGEIPKIF